MARTLVNLLLFQACWFACVLGAAAGRPWVGPALVAASALVHLAWHRRSLEAVLLAAAAANGYAADSVLVIAGLVEFPEAARLGGPSPIWMVAMWVNFATTLNGCLSWLQGRPALAALVGAAGGPLAYAAGAGLGAIELTQPAATVAIAVEWAVATPALLLLASRLGSGLRPQEMPGASATGPVAEGRR